MSHGNTGSSLNHRERATLQAVAAGDAEITSSDELFLAGLACCDQITAHHLARAGFLAPAYQGKPGQRVPAVLTEDGRRALEVSLIGSA